ncbi:NAD(P)-binding domain-containing protein [Actinocorallia longicatena]|uniref:Uncharacterized protein n=1 Tax=Actinocorallia longicatena TaxID=111803 RepID=A0ABP6QE19_9ACTN
MSSCKVDSIVLGAGPYGLSVGAYSNHAGLETMVVGTPMQFWDNHMPEGMCLKSERHASSLGTPAKGSRLEDYHRDQKIPAPPDQPIPIDTFTRYGKWFAAKNIPHIERTQAVAVDFATGGFTVTLLDGKKLLAPKVTMALGARPFAHIPEQLIGLSAALVSHSSDHRDFRRFADKDVIVVGAGQAALETAVLLARAGARPQLLARTKRLQWNDEPSFTRNRVSRMRTPQSGLGTGWRTWVWSERPQVVRYLPSPIRSHIVRTTLGPAGAWWLRGQFDETVEVVLGQRIIAAWQEDDRCYLKTISDQGEVQMMKADHVIAATGFQVDVDRLSLLSPQIRQNVQRVGKSPMLSRTFESTVPGLHFAGVTAASTFGPVMRFVHGADFTASRVVDGLTRKGR